MDTQSSTEKLKWVTAEYLIAELTSGGEVVTQRNVLEKYKADHPDEEVKAHTGFKCDHQSKTVSLRIGIADNTVAADSGTVAKIKDKDTVTNSSKLLQPEYDELVNKLKHAEGQIEEFKKGLAGNPCLCGACAHNIKLQREYDELLEEVRTLRLKAAGREELSKQLDELKDKNKKLNSECNSLIGNVCKLTEENDRLILRLAEKVCDQAEVVGPDEDVADSFNHDTDLSPVKEDTSVENQEPVTGDEKCDCCGNNDCGEVEESDEDVTAVAGE